MSKQVDEDLKNLTNWLNVNNISFNVNETEAV